MVKETYDKEYSSPSQNWRWKKKDPGKFWRDLHEIGLVLGWTRRFMKERNSTRSSQSNRMPMALDIGIGEGRIALPVMKIGIRVFGIDLSPHGIEAAFKASVRAITLSRTQLIVADAENLPFRNQSFSLVYCIGTFEYFKNLAPTLREVQRILLPKGKILFNFRNEGSVEMRALFGQLIRKLFKRNRSSKRRDPQKLRTWKTQYHKLKHVEQILKSFQFVITLTQGYFVFLPSDIERLNRLFGDWLSRKTFGLLKWLDKALGKSIISNKLVNVVAVDAYKSA